jgi:hypothetical protein
MMIEVLEEDIGLLLMHNNTERGVSFQDTAEYDNVLFPLRSPEYPFGEASSSPLDPVMCGEELPVSHLPWIQQDDLDAWLNDSCDLDSLVNDCCNKLKEGTTGKM